MSGVYRIMYMQTHINLRCVMKSLFLLIMLANTNCHMQKNSSYITPTAHVNWGFRLFKIDQRRHCLCFRWISYISGTKTQSGFKVSVVSISTRLSRIRNGRRRDRIETRSIILPILEGIDLDSAESAKSAPIQTDSRLSNSPPFHRP